MLKPGLRSIPHRRPIIMDQEIWQASGDGPAIGTSRTNGSTVPFAQDDRPGRSHPGSAEGDPTPPPAGTTPARVGRPARFARARRPGCRYGEAA